MTDHGPYFVKLDNGQIEPHYPDPPWPSYEVAHEVLVQMVDEINELRRMKSHLEDLARMLDRADNDVPGLR